MRNLKMIISMIGFFLVFAGVKNSYSTTNLVFKIEVDKDTFLLREPIWVDLYFTNNSEKVITLDCIELPWQMLTVNLVNSKGDTLRYGGYIFDGICRAGPSIKPLETCHHLINLSENFGKGAKEHVPFSLRYFDEDTYTLQMIHTGLSSNLLRFKVQPPEGDEKKAYDLIKKLPEKPPLYYSESDLIIQILEELIHRYPNSVYADLTNYELAGHYARIGEPQKTHEYLTKLILNYPNSYYVRPAFWDLLQGKSRGEQIQFLKDILKKIPVGTRAYEWAQSSLKGLEQEEKSKK